MSWPVVPAVLLSPPRAQSIAVPVTMLFTCAGVSDGFASSMSSATPATNGVAMLVPLKAT